MYFFMEKPKIKIQITVPIRVPEKKIDLSEKFSKLEIPKRIPIPKHGIEIPKHHPKHDIQKHQDPKHEIPETGTYLLPLYGQIVRMSIDNRCIYTKDSETLIGTVMDNGHIRWEPEPV